MNKYLVHRYSKFIISLLFLAFVLLLFNTVLPKITIHNDTDEIIYIYTMERNTSLDEPSIEEVDQIKRPKIVNPSNDIEIKPSLSSLLRNNIELDIGWKIGSRVESRSKSGYQWFSIDSKNGVCNFTIRIGTEETERIKGDNRYCFMKINPIESALDYK